MKARSAIQWKMSIHLQAPSLSDGVLHAVHHCLHPRVKRTARRVHLLIHLSVYSIQTSVSRLHYSIGAEWSGSVASLPSWFCGWVQEPGVTGCGKCESARFVGGWVWTSCQNNHIHYILHKRSLPHPLLPLAILSHPPKGSGKPYRSARQIRFCWTRWLVLHRQTPQTLALFFQIKDGQLCKSV